MYVIKYIHIYCVHENIVKYDVVSSLYFRISYLYILQKRIPYVRSQLGNH